MASEAVVALQKVEEKEEQLEVVKQENTDSTPEEVEEVKMATDEELSKIQEDRQEDKQVDPPMEDKEGEKIETPAHEMQSAPEAAKTEEEEQSVTKPEEQVKVEIVEEKIEEVAQETDEPEPSVDVAEKEKETLEVSTREDEPEVVEEKEASKEESIDDEKPKEEITEAQPVEESKAPVLVGEKIELKEAEDEVAVNLEAPIEKLGGDEGEQEEAEALEEIKPRESLGALMKKEVTQGEVIESSDTVAVVDKELEQAEEKGVEPVDDEPEEKEENPGETKEVEEIKKELAEEKLGSNELSKEVVTNGAVQQTDEAAEKSVEAECVSKDFEVSSENKTEGEVTAPVEDKPNGDLKTSEETPCEAVKERQVEEVKPEEKSAKDADEAKDEQDQPKEEAPAKPVAKQSNNIMSKVKQSLVKAKKAIIGKSPSSKSISTDIKGDIKVK